MCVPALLLNHPPIHYFTYPPTIQFVHTYLHAFYTFLLFGSAMLTRWGQYILYTASSAVSDGSVP